MMWNVTCLCKKLHIKIWVSVIVGIVSGILWKICKRPKLNIVGLGQSLHFGVTFLFLQLEALFVSETFRFNAHCVDALINREDEYHNRRKAMCLMVWKSKGKKKKEKKKEKLEERVTEGMERG